MRNKNIISSSRVAELMGVTTRTISEWHKTGKLKADQITAGGHRRYYLERIKDISGTGVFDDPVGRLTCIYQIKNNINGKIYIGSTVNFDQRKKGHLSLLKNCNHPNSHLQSSFSKYGEDSFSFSIVKVVDIISLREEEDFYIEKNKSYDRKIGYNIEKQSNHKRHSVETKRKISESLMGHKVSKESRDKMRQAKIGTNFHMGHKHTEETKEKIRKKILGTKKGPRSEEVKKKISLSNTGQKRSDEARKKMRESRLKYLEGKKNASFG